ncbi:hypothetical protein OG713_26085 [Streptomyces sp. NBC_00723]|uniref:hypothetical protein n=1 Tax=Streptomyces sp. NBC_00723 TaxID=2903673 RepID=UPI00386930E3
MPVAGWCGSGTPSAGPSSRGRPPSARCCRRQRAHADLAHRLAEQGHEPQATWAADGFLAELDRRIAWSEAHRHLVE